MKADRRSLIKETLQRKKERGLDKTALQTRGTLRVGLSDSLYCHFLAEGGHLIHFIAIFLW